jgi:hypothetical protein
MSGDSTDRLWILFVPHLTAEIYRSRNFIASDYGQAMIVFADVFFLSESNRR